MNQKGFSPIFLLLFVGILLVALFAAYTYFKNTPSATPHLTMTTKESASPSSSPSISANTEPIDKDTRYILYTIDTNGFKQIATLKNLDQNPMYGNHAPYLDEEKGQLYVESAKTVSLYSIDGKKMKDIYTATDKKLAVSNFSVVDHSVYVTMLPTDYAGGNIGYIEEVNLDTSKIRRLSSQQTVTYGNLDYLFKTAKGDDVIGSFGGDGCGGFGEIRLMSASQTNILTKTGGGCVDDPRYIGNIPSENKLVLGSVIKGSWQESSGEKWDKLYTKDVYSGEEKTIYAFTTNADSPLTYSADPKTGEVTLLFKKSIKQINPHDGTIDTDIALNDAINMEDGYYKYQNGYLYGLKDNPITKNFSTTLNVAEVKTGNKKQYSMNQSITGQSQILGFLNGQPIISIYNYPDTPQ